MRGRHLEPSFHQGVGGLIPAGAGQTIRCRLGRCPCWAHPRRCGADPNVKRAVQSRTGSSPQVRGRLLNAVCILFTVGLIPAGAGQTRKESLSALAALGSSPQVRGRPRPRRRADPRLGLIPAGAGQTCGSAAHRRHGWAHPRRCGADGVRGADLRRAGGSSPQVRGRHINLRGAHLHGRLIPAGAGQTFHRGDRLRVFRAHPRRCGADLPCIFLCSRRYRLIPAGAGQTPAHAHSSRVSAAHPRRCGADNPACAGLKRADGSSPQVRGRPVIRMDLTQGSRLIPAGAGQTSHCWGGFWVMGGSSPQVRGRPAPSVAPVVLPGLIPAGAGQTC